mmetsp:Transcript_136295/g.379931  ORF Transcript_136295/g.379931 Transcript_136295/m.379931 type:complete len:210 (-) Transcript_136295:589-1218(-)
MLVQRARATYMASKQSLHGRPTCAASPLLLAPQPAGRLHRVVGENDGGACAFDGQEGLQHRLLLVEPAVQCSCLEHSVLARDMVRGNGQIAVLVQPFDDVQVRHARLDHKDVRAFLLVQPCLYQGLAIVGRVLLVGLLVVGHLPVLRWETRVRVERLPERPVEGGGILGTVRHDPDVCVPCGVERIPDSAHSTIHHVAGAHVVRPGLCL